MIGSPSAGLAGAFVRGSRRLAVIATVFAVSLLIGLGVAVGRADAYQLSWSTPVLVNHQPPFAQAASIGGFACVGTSVCFADGAGHVLVSSDPFAGASATWSVENIAGASSIAFSCPSATLCVGVDGLDQSLTTTDPLNGASAAWSSESIDGGPNTAPTDVSCPSVTLCVAVDTAGNVLTTTDPAQRANATWTTENITASGLKQIACPTVDLCVAIDNGGNVLTTDDPANGASATWSSAAVSNPVQLGTLSCPSSALCLATGPADTVYTTTDPTDGSSATWHQETLPTTYGLEGIACTTAPVCVVGDAHGDLLTTSDPANGATATWTSSNVDGSAAQYQLACEGGYCIGGDQRGQILTSTNVASGTWGIELVDGANPFAAISCATASMCVAVDQAGNAATSTSPASGGWGIQQIDSTSPLVGVSCPSLTLCVAVDEFGNALSTTDPAAGATAQWTRISVDPVNGLTAVACSPAGLCAAVDDSGSIYVSTDPGAGVNAVWTPENSGEPGLGAISCPSNNLCIATAGHEVAISTDPAAGAAATWNHDVAIQVGGLGAITCPSTSLCLASDPNGSEFSTTAPTAGRTAAWTLEFNGTAALYGQSCASMGFCAIAEAHDVFTSQEPGVGNWGGTTADQLGVLSGLSCPSLTLCVAVDESGQVTVGTPNPNSMVVGLVGTGSGTVTGLGLSCPADCAETYAPGTEVTLTATPAAGSWFVGWSGACTGQGTCTLPAGPAVKYLAADFSLGQPPAATTIATTTQLTCVYQRSRLGDLCTATVSSTQPGTATLPGGAVQFLSYGKGRFAAGQMNAACTLTPTPASSTSTCAVRYVLPPTGTATVLATYLGDTQHRSSSAEANPLASLGPLGRLITHVSVSPSAFPAAHGGRRARAATIRITMGAPAVVTLTVQKLVVRGQTTSGRHACRSSGGHGRCARWVPVGAHVAVTAVQGQRSMRFPRALEIRVLARGDYQLSATPTIGTANGDTATARFRIT